MDGMIRVPDLNAIASFISTVGFPTACAAFLLWRMNGKVGKLAEAVEKNTLAVLELCGHHARKKKKH